MRVFAFDRDHTVDVNPHPRQKAVPLEWVKHLAHETDHEVWATGNQLLKPEADIPGVHDAYELLSEEVRERYSRVPKRADRVRMLAELFPGAEGYVVVDDVDLGHVDGWTHYYPWDFVDAVEAGELDLDFR